MKLLTAVGRPAVALALAAIVLVPPSLARAEEPIVRDHRGPMARIEIAINKIKVLKDRDWGNGEMLFQMGLYCLPRTATCEKQADSTLGAFRKEFSATDGQIVTIEQTLPAPGSGNPSDEASVYGGYPLYRGQEYELVFSMWEQDGVTSADEYMGDHVMRLTQENAFGIGTHTNLRAARSGGSANGDYEIEFEIRRAPVPDLRATGIKIHELPGNPKKLVCMGVSNAGVADAGPFTVALYVDGLVPPGGAVNAGQLRSGDSGELCGEVALPATGQHLMMAMADPQHSVTEFNEINNTYEQPYTAAAVQSPTGPEAGQSSTASNAKPVDPDKESPATTASASQSQADLTVSAIRVRGQVPDGKDDCKDGKNPVAVVVKNAGTGKAEGFAVRLLVGDDQAGESVVPALDAGQEREIKFDDVRLKKGEQGLTAVVDAKGAVSEAKEDNNERNVIVRCSDDD